MASVAPSPTSADPYRDRVYGNVKLCERIGEGSMGLVYRGRHQGIDRDVAVKLMPPHLADDEQYLKRFLREGRTAARIQHSNVVQVMDAGTAHGTAYLVLELVRGTSIGEVLDEQETMEPGRVAELAVGIAEGLAAIHARGVLHRDIKPDNLLLNEAGEVKVTDLGLARELRDASISRLTATGMVVGTPLYVAPEAIRDNKTAGPKSDVYSLGATLYHMLTGRPPFDGDTPFDVMRAHIDLPPAPVRSLAPRTPPDFAALVERCLAKDPAERPSAAELADLLRARAARAGRWRGPRAVLALLAVGAVLTIAAVTALLVLRS